MSEVLEDVVEEVKELEDDERKDVQEEVVGVDGGEGGEVRIDMRGVSLPIREKRGLLKQWSTHQGRKEKRGE